MIRWGFDPFPIKTLANVTSNTHIITKNYHSSSRVTSPRPCLWQLTGPDMAGDDRMLDNVSRMTRTERNVGFGPGQSVFQFYCGGPSRRIYLTVSQHNVTADNRVIYVFLGNKSIRWEDPVHYLLGGCLFRYLCTGAYLDQK